VETAEAMAELTHKTIRRDWGVEGEDSELVMDLFHQKYRGSRYSFGFAACPNLEDQAKLWKLLNPDEIGVQLTDGFMMEPEASVSGLVFHHPDCVYFTAAEGAEAA
jgi:5-methyltetrahydrofolate--homocysteine methyltransferase